MGHVLILLVVALVAAALVFGVVTMIIGADPGLAPAEPDGAAVPLPMSRPLTESDLMAVRFDTTLRGYRMAEVDQAMRRTAYDLGYKEELINVLEAEVTALREGRLEDADELRRAREHAAQEATLEDEDLEDEDLEDEDLEDEDLEDEDLEDEDLEDEDLEGEDLEGEDDAGEEVADEDGADAGELNNDTGGDSGGNPDGDAVTEPAGEHTDKSPVEVS
jgi:DivIVA domain-containing protein